MYEYNLIPPPPPVQLLLGIDLPSTRAQGPAGGRRELALAAGLWREMPRLSGLRVAQASAVLAWMTVDGNDHRGGWWSL